jgi:hypothetical protein
MIFSKKGGDPMNIDKFNKQFSNEDRFRHFFESVIGLMVVHARIANAASHTCLKALRFDPVLTNVLDANDNLQ